MFWLRIVPYTCSVVLLAAVLVTTSSLAIKSLMSLLIWVVKWFLGRTSCKKNQIKSYFVFFVGFVPSKLRLADHLLLDSLLDLVQAEVVHACGSS